VEWDWERPARFVPAVDSPGVDLPAADFPAVDFVVEQERPSDWTTREHF